MYLEPENTDISTAIDTDLQDVLDGPGIVIEEIDVPEDSAGLNKAKLPLTNFKHVGKNKKELVPADTILNQILDRSGGWPKSVSGLLMVQETTGKLKTLKDSNALFAWLHELFNVEWAQMSGISKAEFYQFALEMCEKYDYWSDLPHYPPVHGVLYANSTFPNSGGETLEQFLNFFSPATDTDASLIKALALTLFWGGPPGQRPAFLITTDDKGPSGGVGFGKSTLAEKMAGLCGGSITVYPSESTETVNKRILSPADGKSKHRALLLDNIKTLKLSDAGMEALITSTEISGHRMYGGHATVPNYFTVLMTVNGASLSRDLASRCVTIILAEAPKDQNWLSNLNAFVEGNRHLIIGDIGLLLESQGHPLPNSGSTRWATWEAGVLSKADHPEECRKLIIARQKIINDDVSGAKEFVELMQIELPRSGPFYETNQNHKVASATINQMAELLQKFTGNKVGLNKVSKLIKMMGLQCLHRVEKKGHKSYYLFRKDGKRISAKDIKEWHESQAPTLF
jgi:hypothetical protein